MTAVLNPAAVAARAARRAEREAHRAAAAAHAEVPASAELTEWAAEAAATGTPDWDAPIDYTLAPGALDAPTVTVSAVALHAMASAVKAATSTPSDNTPVLELARVTLADGAATIIATDRYRVHRLVVPADGAADAVGFVRAADLMAVARALAPAAARKALAPVAVTVDADAHTMTWATDDASHTTSWDEHLSYPPVEKLMDPEGERVDVATWHVNPRFLADALGAAAVSAERNRPVRVTAEAASRETFPMVRVSAGDPTAAAGRFDSLVMTVRP